MVNGVDIFLICFMGFYGLLITWCFSIAAYKLYKFINRKKKPNLILIRGGKEDKKEGPNG